MDFLPVAIINYNGKNTLLQTIASLYESNDVKVKIYVFDDCSTDEGLDLVFENYPDVELYKHPQNSKNPNILRNIAIKQIESDKIFITDNDIIFDPNCLKELSDAFNSKNSVATCSPRLMYLGDEERTYFAGTQIHFMAAAIGHYRDQVVDHSNDECRTNSGGGILLLDREKAIEVGMFDEDYGLAWGDDGEFYQRLLLRGYECIYVPTAFGLHENKVFCEGRYGRAVGQVTNRLLFIFTHYSKRTIFFLIPAFILYELMEFIFMFVKKLPSLFFKGELEFIKKLPLVKKKRNYIQGLRRVSDKKVLHSGDIYISPDIINGNKVIKNIILFVHMMFNYYWKIISSLIP